MANSTDTIPEQRATPKRKNLGRVPKKEHKSRREKLKRYHLNELFLELGRALEPSSRHTNGKASIVVDATRFLRYLIAGNKTLRKENAALDIEYHYLIRENDEFRDENSALQADIERLQNDLRRTQPDPIWPNGMDMIPSTLDLPTTAAMQIEEQAAGPLYLISNHQELHPFSETGNTPPLPNPSSNVSRPRARYPTSSDSWPLELLSKHYREAHETHHSLSSRTTSNCTEGSDTSRE
ncbi:protein IRON-RELATED TRANSCRIPTION FACTOR 3-like isoform X1 [Typha latifolia]|uniref:protein IRON-RELATED TRANSCRIPTION FACTOR 3-like isoform X1 n=1 Tax=Typha latifolia TaxID=4733 RepID=UPI003C304D7C